MIEKYMRWLLPFLAIALIAMYLVLTPILPTRAAAPKAPVHYSVTHHGAGPNRYWRP